MHYRFHPRPARPGGSEWRLDPKFRLSTVSSSPVARYRTRTVVAVIPFGTGNTFAYDLGILSPDQAVSSILAGRIQAVDVAEVRSVTTRPISSAKARRVEEGGEPPGSACARKARSVRPGFPR